MPDPLKQYALSFMEPRNFQGSQTLILLLFTFLGVAGGQVTVFYMVYLFWFQELIRTFVDFVYLFQKKKGVREKVEFMKIAFGSFFILFIYVVFIILLFGVLLNWGNRELTTTNMQILFFHNWYFNANMFLFLTGYMYVRFKEKTQGLQLLIFNRRHLILHISIIMGALLQLAVVPQFRINNLWASALVVLPFLFLKTLFDKTPPSPSVTP